MRKFHLHIGKSLAPGDVVVASALLRDLSEIHRGEAVFRLHAPCSALIRGNPNQAVFSNEEGEHVELCYAKELQRSNKGIKQHFLTAYFTDFHEKTGLESHVLQPKPDMHLLPHEQKSAPVSGKYWLVLAGGKMDFTVKHWDFGRYQEVITQLSSLGYNMIPTGAVHPGHKHVPMKDTAMDLVGWGGLREFIWQVAYCEGVISPITCGMHLAAAFDKPCVVIAGGREEPWWEQYSDSWEAFGEHAGSVKTPHRYLHTVGQLPCCMDGGCWKNKVVQINNDAKVCTTLANRAIGMQVLPECMQKITVEDVVNAVLSYA
jgi:hypothetical protein